MSKIAAETVFGSLPSYNYIPSSSYSSSQLGLGYLMVQNYDGVNATNNWAGPLPIGVIRPMEYSVPFPATYPWAIQWSNNLDWIFLADNSTASGSRKIMMATLNRNTGDFGIYGYVGLTYPVTTNHTIKAFRMSYDTMTNGSVAVASGSSTVSGSGTNWSSSRACIGNRIGFGSNIPSNISTWYEIGSFLGNGGITLTTPCTTTYATGSQYVIEDLRAITVNTNATVANGGVFVTKGLRPEIFLPSGTGIGAATTTDCSRSVYWLADASSVVNSGSFGAGIDTTSADF
jgi:hypothetical protein